MLEAGTTTILIALTILCTSVAQLLQKQAATTIHESERGLLTPNITVIQSIFLLGLGTMLWLGVLSRVDVSIAYPLLSLNFVIVPLLARWRLDEEIPLNRIYGSAIIVVGLSFVMTG